MLLWPGVGTGTVPGGGGRIGLEPLDVTARVPVIDHLAPVLAGLSGSLTRMAAAGIILVVLGLAGVAVWRYGLSSVVFGESETEPTGPATGPSTGDASVDESSATDAAAAGESAVDPGTAGQGGEPVGELTDQEIVVDILDDHDGRMKQARIVDETGWSKSKVSMLLSDMEDEGDISKLRVGRENIISLSGNEPEAAGSPFDDE